MLLPVKESHWKDPKQQTPSQVHEYHGSHLSTLKIAQPVKDKRLTKTLQTEKFSFIVTPL